jgi:diacylglycerol kinase (ATP)
VPASGSIKILFVLNPVSGGRSKVTWETGIRDYFKNNEGSYEIYNTTGQADHESLGYWIKTWKPDTVVAVGGDGTLKLVAEVLQGTDTPIAVFPAGSANGMAREIGMPAELADCMEVLQKGHTRKVDVIRINDEDICLHLSDIGMNAQMVKYFEQNNVRGKMGYARELIKVLYRKRLMEISIKNKEANLKREAFMVVFANARMYGTGARINPEGNISDGIFEVVIIRKLSFVEFFKMLFLNRPFNPEKIEVLQADSVTIRVKKRAYFQVDGEYRGRTRKISAHIEAGALLMLVPEEMPE